MTHPSVHCDQVEAHLADYFEGALGDSTVADIELHLASCATCRALVADLTSLQSRAAALPQLLPSRDLWPDIVAQIEARSIVPLPRPRSHALRLWGAAAGLVAATALITLQVARREPLTAPVVAPPTAAVATTPAAPSVEPPVPPQPSTPQLVARKPAVRSTLSAEIQGLESVVDARNNALDPETLAILQSSLHTIDSAITQAKAALRRDPGSAFLSQQLDRSLQRKLGLLRQASLLGAKI